MMRRGGSKPTSKTLDAIRLAIAAVREAADLRDAFEQVCVGASRVTGGDKVVLAVEQSGRLQPAAHIGRMEEGGMLLLQRAGLSIPGARPRARADDPMVAPYPAQEAAGAIVVQGARQDTLPALELFAEVAGGLCDLQVVRNRSAAAAHRVQPLQQLGGLVGSLRAGDGVVLIAIDQLSQVGARLGRDAVDSLTQAVGIHLLNATRPPGDVVATFHDNRFLVVLRDLKAPVEVVGRRVIDTWQASRPTASIAAGAALHVGGAPPMQTLERAEVALASAIRSGGGQLHVSPPWSGPSR